MNQDDSPSKLLDRVQACIAKDVASIEKDSTPYLPDVANKLVRYVGALVSMQKDRESELDKLLKSLKGKKDEELEAARSILKGAGSHGSDSNSAS